jgi:hypothetical protein
MSNRKMQFVTLQNISSNQTIGLQVKPPKGDFYLDEQQVRLSPGDSVVVPKDHLLWSQIENCKAKKQLRVIES